MIVRKVYLDAYHSLIVAKGIEDDPFSRAYLYEASQALVASVKATREAIKDRRENDVAFYAECAAHWGRVLLGETV